MSFVCGAPLAPRSPGTVTAWAEMMVSSCRACRQGSGIQSEGGCPPALAWGGEAKPCVLQLTRGQPWLVAGKQRPGSAQGEQPRGPCEAGQGSLDRARRKVPGECQ